MSKVQDMEIPSKAAGDVETGMAPAAAAAAPLYPKMTEDPRLRWMFIRKVYAIIAVQFTFTAGVASIISFVRPIPKFLLSNTSASWGVFFALLLLPLLALWPMLRYRERHPINLVLLAIYTLCVSLSIGVACVTVSGRVVLQAVILAAAVVIGLTLYTFWAARRGRDFAFLFPFLFACLLVLLVYCIMQIFLPLSSVASTIYACVASIVFSGFIIFDTDKLIKRHAYNEYLYAAISLYMDMINLFMSLLTFSSCH
ncbi:BI1-like protein [Canna indica]|uniref:BI1-like protein n=1 Tax=Canna indica TaxID=4628 RepID=A0AAQ3JM54_9LILI|nr:BI1-like protein [Canna indica]